MGWSSGERVERAGAWRWIVLLRKENMVKNVDLARKVIKLF